MEFYKTKTRNEYSPILPTCGINFKRFRTEGRKIQNFSENLEHVQLYNVYVVVHNVGHNISKIQLSITIYVLDIKVGSSAKPPLLSLPSLAVKSYWFSSIFSHCWKHNPTFSNMLFSNELATICKWKTTRCSCFDMRKPENTKRNRKTFFYRSAFKLQHSD